MTVLFWCLLICLMEQLPELGEGEEFGAAVLLQLERRAEAQEEGQAVSGRVDPRLAQEFWRAPFGVTCTRQL